MKDIIGEKNVHKKYLKQVGEVDIEVDSTPKK